MKLVDALFHHLISQIKLRDDSDTNRAAEKFHAFNYQTKAPHQQKAEEDGAVK